LRILLVSDQRLRLDGGAGPLTIEADSAEMQYSPFHMLASGLAMCIHSVLHSWATNAKLDGSDLAVEVEWTFAEEPHRVGEYRVELVWPSLPESRRAAAERAAHLCTVKRTFEHPPHILTRVKAA
jgi:uncharacterized OsmC-like protein